MSKIAVFGDICIDHYVNQKKHFLGGNAFNVSYHLMSLGDSFVLFSPIGEDKYTSIIQQKIIGLGIECELLRLKYDNQSIDITLDEYAERSFSSYQGDILSHIYTPEFSDFDYIIAPFFKEIRPLINPVLELNPKKMILDLSEADDVSEQELLGLSKKCRYINISKEKYAHELLLSLSTDCIFTVTLASRGARVYCNGLMYKSQTPQVIQVIDTTGAGDSFFAFMASNLIKGSFNSLNFNKLVDSACAYTYSTLLRLGAVPVKITI